MTTKLLKTLIQGNAKFAKIYTAPPAQMKIRGMWEKGAIKGVTVGMGCSAWHSFRQLQKTGALNFAASFDPPVGQHVKIIR